MKIKFILIIAITVLMLCGCQATPNETIVFNKGDNKLQEIIQSTPVPTKQVLTETQWTENYNITNLECDINVQIVLPDKNTFPVYKVAKRTFGSSTADKIIKYLADGATGVRVTSPTKEELEEELIIAKKGAYIEDDNGGRWEPYDGQQEDIKNLEEQIRNASPEKFNPINNDISLPIDNTYSMPDGSRKYITVSDNRFRLTTDKYGIVQLESWIVGGNAVPGEPVGTTLDNVKITEEKARNKVSTVISALGIDNMGIAEAEKARIINNYTNETITEGWLYTLTRNDGNSIPVYLDSSKLSGVLYFGTDDYVERWWPETITIFVDETGIRSFYWIGPLEVTEEMNSNVSLLPFEDIKERIRRNIEFGFLQRVQKGQVHGQHKITINKIVLSNVLVPLKNDLDRQMLLPAWLVYYGGSQDDNKTFVFAVNAIDGSSIDLAMRRHKLES